METYHILHQKDTFAAGLAVEQPIGLLRLRKLPAVREQTIDGDLAIEDEARAIGLDDCGEGPGADDGELLAQHVRADIEGHAAAFANEPHDTPCPTSPAP